MKEGYCLKKRPCRVCRRWFKPDARLKGRQMTCGRPECQREWHRRRCARWNRKNSEYFKAGYLQRKLSVLGQGQVSGGRDAFSGPLPGMRAGRLPGEFLQEVIGIQFVVIIDYIIQHLLRRVQEVIKRQVVGDTG
jgi:hypothetical protein